MTKQHTSKSLARYLGQMIVYNDPLDPKGHSLELPGGQLISVDIFGIVTLRFDSVRGKDELGFPVRFCYPILKTYDKLTDDDIQTIAAKYWERSKLPKLSSKQEGFLDPIIIGLPPRRYTYFEFDNFELWIDENFVFGEPAPIVDKIVFNTNYEGIEALVDLGFGAIPNPESPTGYVDLFGYPCVGEE